MKNAAWNKLIAYAMHFASFLIERGVNARGIILFGSVASGEFDKESDIDIFIDTGKGVSQSGVLGLQDSFEKTFGEKWRLKGVTNQLSITVGDISSKEWEDLRRTIQSQGIIIYGQYNEPPKGIQPFVLFNLNFRGISRSRSVGLWRKLYGYAQKVGVKSYKTKGLIEQLGGIKVEKGIVLVPAANAAEVKGFLGKNKVSFGLVELWSDQLSTSELEPYVGKKFIGSH